ncbi:MAG: NADPH:quinone oxidoreductase family protein [Novosphingobium sp.]|nr:NADPH:quinone oxidoreductase family protein [Novosphingobium sp.]
MRALRSHEPGGPETLVVDELETPQPGEGEVLIAVKAVGINFPDTLIIRDLYQYKPPRPFSPGIELAGVIESVGPGVTGWCAGDRVLALPTWGALCEKIAVAQDRIYALPDGIDFEPASGLLLTYGTSLHALKDRADLKPGETLLVLGAAGGAGLSAVELGKAMGAKVVAAVSSEEKADVTRAAGADEVVLYGRPPFDRDQSRALVKAFKDACGPDGAHVIYDAVGGDYAEPALRAIAWQGRYLVIGFTAGIPQMPLNLTLLKSCDIRGVFFGAVLDRDPAHIASLTQDLFAMVKDGLIAPRVSQVLPLERGGEAIALLADRKALGKVVVRVGD